jgi:hypothetical protein
MSQMNRFHGIAIFGLATMVLHGSLSARPPVAEETISLTKTADQTELTDQKTLIVDAQEHCIFLNETQRPTEKAAKLKLLPNHHYTVTAAGKAFLSQHRGSKADPFPGVVIFYCSNEEDGYATKSQVLAPGETLSFTTPRKHPKDIFLSAFFIDYWPKSKNRGQYELAVVEQSAARGIEAENRRAASAILNFTFADDPGKGNYDGIVGSANDRADDHWNFVDYGQRKIDNIRFADGSSTDIEMEVSDNDGEWGIDDQKGINHGYIYHNCQCVDLSVSLNYLPQGIYEVYVFAHGDAPDQNAAIEIESGETKLTGKATLNDGTWKFNSTEYQEGNQYVRYIVEVTDDSPITITSKRDGSNYSMFNAIQLRRIRTR